MIIPVVTKDIIYFSKLQSISNKDRYSLQQVKSKEDILIVLFKCDYPLCLLDFSCDLIESFKLKDLLKNRGCHTISSIAYYPHIQKDIKQKAIDYGTTIQVTRNELYKNLNIILDDAVFNEITST
tara:strand:+ start:122 stop:496 length:375 start_codon:yes stop_codon:yes gene_type:complete